MPSAQGRFSPWTFVQAIRANPASGLRARTPPDRALLNLLLLLRRPVGTQPPPNVRADVKRDVDLGLLPEDGQGQIGGDDPVRLVYDLGDLQVDHQASQHVSLDGLEPVCRAYVLDHRP